MLCVRAMDTVVEIQVWDLYHLRYTYIEYIGLLYSEDT